MARPSLSEGMTCIALQEVIRAMDTVYQYPKGHFVLSFATLSLNINYLIASFPAEAAEVYFPGPVLAVLKKVCVVCSVGQKKLCVCV